MALEKELQYFESIKESLLKHHEGKFVLIQGDQLVSAFDDPKTAYDFGVGKFGDQPFLVKKVTKETEIHNIPALTLGVINASL